MKQNQTFSAQTTMLNTLRMQWWKLGCGSLCWELVSFWALHNVWQHVWQPAYAWQWLFQTLVILAYVFGTLRVLLPFNHRKGDLAILPTLGIGTLMTVCRGVLISMLAGFLFLPWSELPSRISWLHWVPGAVYLLAAVADYFDGYLARRTNHVTRLGEILDTKLDALGILIATLVAIDFGQLPVSYIAVGAAYYLFTFGIWMRKRSGKAIIDLQAYPEARILAGFQMGLLSVVLFPVLSPPVTTIAALIFMIPFLIGFVRDWLVVCGRMSQGFRQWSHRRQTLHQWMVISLPLGLRVLLLGAGWMILQDKLFSFSDLQSVVWNSIHIVVCVMVLFGFVGRAAALLLSVSTGLMIMRYGSVEPLLVMYSCALALTLTGTGALSLWQPEDTLLFKRAGEKE